MAKKKPDQIQPVVSSLPLPKSETPLVIDLPDGQKLVVGKMETGTVIEVATWRGTGRPDSRTNRLMLGMSSSEAIEQKDKSQESPRPIDNSKMTKAKLLLERILLVAKKLFSNSMRITRTSVGKLRSNLETRSKSKLNNAVGNNSVAISRHNPGDLDPDIEAFLARIKTKHAIGVPTARPDVTEESPGSKMRYSKAKNSNNAAKSTKKRAKKR